MTAKPMPDSTGRFAGSDRLRILFTEGSSTSARETLYALGPRHSIDVVDPSRICQARFSRFVRRWHRCPPYSADPEAYLKFLFNLVRTGQYDVLFPTHEQVFLLARYREAFSRHVGLAVPEFSAVDRTIGKAQFARLLDEVGLPQPVTEIVTGRRQLVRSWPFPCYVKVAHSTAGQGVRLVHDLQGLQQVAEEFDRLGWFDNNVELLVQQPAKGIKSAVSGIFQHGRMVAVYCEQAGELGVGGSPIDRTIVFNDQAVADFDKLGRHLNWHGAMTVEYFYDRATNSQQYTECNPRAGETVIAVLSGVNPCEQLVRVSLGEHLEPVPPPRSGVRTYKGFLSLLALAERGATRRQLLTDLWNRCTGHGFFEGGEDELTRCRNDWMSIIPDLAVSLRLLVSPSSVHRIIQSTVNSYSLSESAAEIIRNLPRDILDNRSKVQPPIEA